MALTQAIELIRSSIVQICLFQAQGSRRIMSIPLGTGFILNKEGVVITANHIIQTGQQIMRDQGLKFTAGLAIPNTENMRGNFILTELEVIDQDERHDLAILKLRKNPFKGELRSGIMINNKEIPFLYGIATLNPMRPNDGAAIGISGYPLGQPVLVTNAGYMATTWSFEKTPSAVPIPGTEQWFHKIEVDDCYFADVEVNPGNSGGPVYLIENAKVIGICVGSILTPISDRMGQPINGLSYSSGLTKVVPVRYAINLLQRHSYSWSG